MQNFDNLADFFDRAARTLLHRNIVAQFIERMEAGPKHATLDVGCGAGAIPIALAPNVKEAVGVDAAGKMIERARANAEAAGLENARFLKGSAYQLEFPDNSFDRTSAMLMIHLLDRPGQGLREMIRVTKPGGRVAVLTQSDAYDSESAADYVKRAGLTGDEADIVMGGAASGMSNKRYSENQLSSFLKENLLKNVAVHSIFEGFLLIGTGQKP